MARVIDLLKSPLGFLFTRPQRDELVAEYIVREHHRGRDLTDILDDAYVKNRCTPDQLRRVLERPEVVKAVGDDMAASHLAKL